MSDDGMTVKPAVATPVTAQAARPQLEQAAAPVVQPQAKPKQADAAWTSRRSRSSSRAS